MSPSPEKERIKALEAALREAALGFQLIADHPPMPETMREIARQELGAAEDALTDKTADEGGHS